MGRAGGHEQLLIFSIGLAASLAVVAGAAGYVPTKDALQYDRYATHLLSHRTFSDDVLHPTRPTMAREPLYPIFLAVVYALCGHSYRAVQLAQALLHACMVLVLYRIASTLLLKRWALTVALLAAVLPPLLTLTSVLLTETLFTLLLALSLWSLVRASRGPSLGWALASGVALGLATLCRAVTMWLWMPLGLTWLWQARARARGRTAVPSAWKPIMAWAVAFLLTISPWLIRNALLFQRPTIRSGLGQQLWMRAARLDRSDRELYRGAVFGYSAVLGHWLFPDVNATEEAERILWQEDWLRLKQLAPSADQSLSPAEDRLLLRDSLLKIQRHPFRYVAHSSINVVIANSFGHVTIPSLRAPGLITDALRAAYLLAAFPGLCVLMVVGMVRSRPWWPQGWIFPIVTVIYFNVVHSLVWSSARLNAPVYPYSLLLAAAAIQSRRDELFTSAGEGYTPLRRWWVRTSAALGQALFTMWRWCGGRSYLRTDVPDSPRRILVLRICSIGDVVVFTPLLERLRDAYPSASVTLVVGRPASAEIVAGSPWVDEVIVALDQPYAGLAGRWRLLRTLARGPYDLVINSNQDYSLWSGLLSYATRSPVRIGFASHGRGFWYSRTLPLNLEAHEVEENLRLLSLLDIPVGRPRLHVFVPPAAQAAASQLFAAHQLDHAPSLIAIHPGGHRPTRRWFLDRFERVASAIVQRFPARLLILGADDERSLVQALAEHMPGRAVPAVGLPLPQVAALLERCALLLCNDSVLMHIAAAVGTPCVAIFGPGNLHKWRPYGDPSLYDIVKVDVPCSPCYTWHCERPGDKLVCLELVTVEAVLQAVERQLRQVRQGQHPR